MSVTVESVTDLVTDDVLCVVGTVGGENVTAYGWASATRNHYPPECYDANGNLIDGSSPRFMDKDEIVEYAKALLIAAVPPTPVRLV